MAGSGMAEPLTVPCKEVTPAIAPPPSPEGGGTSRKLLLMAKVKPPINAVAFVNVITPVLAFCEIVPVSVPAGKRLALPGIGDVCMILMVSVVGIVMAAPVPVVVARMSPKLALVGVLSWVEAAPTNVRVSVLPALLVNVTAEVPVPLVAPVLVKVPEVLKVTRSALADCGATKAIIMVTAAIVREVFKKLVIGIPLLSFDSKFIGFTL